MEVNRLIDALCLEGYSPKSPTSTENTSERSPSPEPSSPSYLGNEIRQRLLKEGIIDENGYITDINRLPPLPSCLPEECIKRVEILLNNYKKIFTSITKNDRLKVEQLTGKKLPSANKYSAEINYLRTLKTISRECGSTNLKIRGSACLYILAPLIEKLLKCKTPFHRFPKDTDVLFKGNFTRKNLEETRYATLANVVVSKSLDDTLLYALKKQTLFPEKQPIFWSQKSASTTFSIGKLDVTLAHGPLKRSHLFGKDNLHLPVDTFLIKKFGDTASIPIAKDQQLAIWQAIIDNLTRTIHIDQPTTINPAGVLRLFYLLSLDWKYLDKTALPILLKRVPFSKMDKFDAKIEQILHDHKDYTASGKVAVLLNLLSTLRPKTKDLKSITIPKTRNKKEHPFLVHIGSLLKNNRLSYQTIESLVTYLTLCNSPKLQHVNEGENTVLHLDHYRWSFPRNIEKSLKTLQNSDSTAQEALLPLLLEYNPLKALSIPNALHHATRYQKNNSPLLNIIGLQLMLSLNKPEQLLHYYIEHKPTLDKIDGAFPIIRHAYEQLLKTYPWLKGESEYHEKAISKIENSQVAYTLYKLLPPEKQKKHQNQIFKRLLSESKTEPQQVINLLKHIRTMPPQNDLSLEELRWIGEQAIHFDEDESIWFWLQKSLLQDPYTLNELCLYAIELEKYPTAITINTLTNNTRALKLLQNALLENDLELAKDFSKDDPSFAKKILQKECPTLKAKPLLEKLDQHYCQQLDLKYLSNIRQKCLKKLSIENARNQASRLIEENKLTLNDIEEITRYLLDKTPEPQWNDFLSSKLQFGKCPLPILRRLLDTSADTTALHQAILNLPPSTEVALTLLTLSPEQALLKQKLPGLINVLLGEEETETLFTLLSTFPSHLEDNELLHTALQHIFERTDQWERFGQLVVELNINPNSPFLQTSQVGIKEVIKKCQKQPLTCLELLKKHHINDKELWETNLNQLFPSPPSKALPLLLHAHSLGFMSFKKWEKTLKTLSSEQIVPLLANDTLYAKLVKKDPIKFLQAHLESNTKDLTRIKPLLKPFLTSPLGCKFNTLSQLINIGDKEVCSQIHSTLLKQTNWSNSLVKGITPVLFHKWIVLEQLDQAQELLNSPQTSQALSTMLFNKLKLQLTQLTASDSAEDQIQILIDQLKVSPNSSQAKFMLEKVSDLLIDAFFNGAGVFFFSDNYLKILEAIHPEDKKWIADQRNLITLSTNNSKSACLKLSTEIKAVNTSKYQREQRKKDLTRRRLDPRSTTFTTTLYDKLISHKTANYKQIIPVLTEAQKLFLPLFKGAYYTHPKKLRKMLEAFTYYEIPPDQPDIERIKMYKGIYCILKSSEVDLFLGHMEWFDQINQHAFVPIPCIDQEDFVRLWNSSQKTLPRLCKKNHHIDLHRALFIMRQILNNSLKFKKESTLELSRTFFETYMPDIIKTMSELKHCTTIQNVLHGKSEDSTIPIFSVIRSFLFENPCFTAPSSSEDKATARKIFLLYMQGLNHLMNNPPEDATSTRILGEVVITMQLLNRDLYSDAKGEFTELAQDFFDHYAELHAEKKNVTLFNLIFRGEDISEDSTTKYLSNQLITSAQIMTILGAQIKEKDQQLLIETGIKPLIKALSRLGSADLQKLYLSQDIYSMMHAMLLNNPTLVKKEKTFKEHAILQDVALLYIEQLQNAVTNQIPNTSPNFLIEKIVQFICTAHYRGAFDGNYKGYLEIVSQITQWYFNRLNNHSIVEGEVFAYMHSLLLKDPNFMRENHDSMEHDLFQEIASLYLLQLQKAVACNASNFSQEFLIGKMVKFIRTAYCGHAFDGNYKGYLEIVSQFIRWYFTRLDDHPIKVDCHSQDYFFSSLRLQPDSSTIVWPLTQYEKVLRANTFYNYLAIVEEKNIENRYTQILEESYAFANRTGIFHNMTFYFKHPAPIDGHIVDSAVGSLQST